MSEIPHLPHNDWRLATHGMEVSPTFRNGKRTIALTIFDSFDTPDGTYTPKSRDATMHLTADQAERLALALLAEVALLRAGVGL